MNWDELEEQREREEREELAEELFGGMRREEIEKWEKWFEVRFGIHQGAFRVVNGTWDAIDAARQDAFRLVYLHMKREWEEVNGN